MKRSELVMWITARGCVRTVDVARRLGISIDAAQLRLRRLRRRGVVSVVWARGTAWWCVPGAQPLAAPRALPGHRESTVEAVLKTESLISHGCATTASLMGALGLSHTQALYVLRLLQTEGRVVEVVVGNTALWCRDRVVAVEFVERLRETVHRLAVSNSMRYATPSRILRAVQRDKEAYLIFSRIIPLSRTDEYFCAAALAFVSGILRLLYGEPVVHTRRKTVYAVSQPRPLEIDIRDRIDENIVSVSIPDELAETLQNVNDINEVVLQALEQLLARYRT